MHTRRLATLVAVLVVTGLAPRGRPAAQPVANQPSGGFKAPPADELLKLDNAARDAFEKAHPAVLPEGPIRARLPLPSAKRFNWCDLNQDFFVHNQGKSPSCWANAGIEALECNWLIRNGIRHSFSPQPILDHSQRPNGGNGALAFDVLLRHGTADFAQYKFSGSPGKVRKDVPTRYRAVAWGQIGSATKPATVAQVKAALLRHGPMVVNLFSTPAFTKYTAGVFAERFRPPRNGPQTNHDVLLLGWDDTRGRGAWYIKNSWGTNWGDRGYGWVEYGSNNVCHTAWWVRAQSTYYPLPRDAFVRLVPGADPPAGWESPIEPVAEVNSVRLEHNVVVNQQRGLVFHVAAAIARAKGRAAQITVFIQTKDGRPLVTSDRTYASQSGELRVRKDVVPGLDQAWFKDVALFLPYAMLPRRPGTTEYRFVVDVWAEKKWRCGDKKHVGSFTFSTK